MDGFLNAVLLSVVIVICDVVWGVFIKYLSAYALLDHRLPGYKKIMLFFMLPSYIGGGVIASYVLYSKLGLMNNFLLYFLPAGFSAYDVAILRGYMNGLPNGLREAARLDGASEFQVLWKIMFPLSMPIIATISLWAAVASWNDWATTHYYFSRKENMHTLSYKLMKVLKESETMQKMLDDALKRGEGAEVLLNTYRLTPEAVKSAQIIVTTLPIIMVYPFLQKYFIKGVLIGAIKD